MSLSQKEAERLAKKVRMMMLCRDDDADDDDDGDSPLLSFPKSSSTNDNDDNDDNNDDKNDTMIIIRKEEIATLWDGMGRIYLITTTTKTSSTTTTSSNDTSDTDDDDDSSIDGSHYQFQFIVKYIDHTSRSCRLPVSDKRKVLQSYVNEAKFYKFHSEQLRKQQQGIGLPQSYYVESSSGSSSANNNATTTTIICMSVLQNINIPIPSSIISTTNNNNIKYHHHLTIHWLASFHAATWQRPYPSSDNSSDTNNNNDKLDESQEVQYGSFWHYDTRRPNMWKMMLSDEGWEGRIKLAAKPIHEWLQTKTQLKSWIHGDMKPDNIMWDNNSKKQQQQKQKQIAVCDFQYVGQGCPCQDLVYFLCTSGNISISAGTENDENNNNGDDNRDNKKNNHKKNPLVDIYFEELLSKLLPLISTQNNDTATTKKSSSSSPQTPPPMTRHEFDVALEISYCDYMRFLCCVVHRHQKHFFTKQYNDLIPIVQTILDKIDGGINLGSEEAYRDAIDKYCCL